jgi:hypothetical protein
MSQKSKKQSLGQFYTTNYEYILQNLFIPETINTIIEPFCGEGHLLQFIKQKEKYTIESYDIDPKKEFIIRQDTILNPPNFNNKFILTNPPYLARNKSEDKTLFDKYDVNDLFKCIIREILVNKCIGGILIIPLNFWCHIRKNDIQLRQDFLKIYDVLHLNIFEEPVFDDTNCSICSFQFQIKNNSISQEIPITVYPSKLKINANLNRENNFLIGGNIYNLPLKMEYKISRLTNKNKDKKWTKIVAKCIDDNQSNQLGLFIMDNSEQYIDYTPNCSARTYATLIIEPEITAEKQSVIVEKCNIFLSNYRKKYNSLFLANYRESNDIARKRISFDLIYNIVEFLLENEDINIE